MARDKGLKGYYFPGLSWWHRISMTVHARHGWTQFVAQTIIQRLVIGSWNDSIWKMLSGFSYQANFHRGMIAIDVRSNFNLQSVQHAIRVLDSSLCKTRVECIGAGGCITLKQTYRMNRISVGIISKIQPCHHGLFVFQILYFKSCISKQWNILVSFIRPIKGVDRSRQCTSFAFSTLNSISDGAGAWRCLRS